MGLIFKKLFNVELRHDYYVSGITNDFDIVPTAETQEIMKNNKLLLRKDNTGFRLMYRTLDDGVTSFFPFTNLDLRFALIMKPNPGFMNFTDLTQVLPGPDKDFAAGNLAQFSNVAFPPDPVIPPSQANLPYSIIDFISPQVLTYAFPQTSTSAVNGSIQIFNQAGANVTPASPPPNAVLPVLDQNSPTTLYRYSYPIDFSSLPKGLYKFVTVVGANTQTRFVYLDSGLASQQVFGIVQIKFADASAGSFPSGRKYNAKFELRKSFWRYILVLKSGIVNVANDVGVIDDGTMLTPPYSLSPYVFTIVSNNTFVNGFPAVIYESQIKIPFFELAKKGLYVAKDFSTTPVLVLANIQNATPEVVSSVNQNFNKTVIYVFV